MIQRHYLPATLASICLASCVVPEVQKVPNPDTARSISSRDLALGGTIEVYFDGTANDWQSRTNVRRRFEMIATTEDPKAKCLYVDGVGNDSVIAMATGIGMKTRVVEGYKFISKHWQGEKTKIRIFGFSRGSFQARMLTGMLAHCGLAQGSGSRLTDKDIDQIANQLWKLSSNELKDAPNGATAEEWEDHLRANRAAAMAYIQKNIPHATFANPDVEFLGIWDTVPGLPFYKWKGVGEGSIRYKVRPYPNTRTIGHALALDERRSRFAPLRVGPPLNPNRTTVYEVWFPGAHADIGGGYSDSNDMAGVTFNWMHKLMLEKKTTIRGSVVYSDATGILHRSDLSFPNNIGSESVARVLPPGSIVDNTVFVRANASRPYLQGKRGTPVSRSDYRPELEVDGRGKLSIGKTSASERKGLLEGFGLRYNNSSAAFDDQKETASKATTSVESMEIKLQPTPPEKLPEAMVDSEQIQP